MKPTKQQNAIIDFPGSAVVIASPGSGKTFVISEKIRKQLRELSEFQGVIAISYTNKSSAELQRRCLANGLPPKNSFFGTIDKFCISEIIIPFGKQVIGLPSREIKVKTISNLNEEQQADLSWYSKETTFETMTSEHITTLSNIFRNGLIVLEAVGLLAEYLLKKSTSCKKYLSSRYKFIYIDEYQDSGLSQHKIFLEIKNLGVTAIAVGDLNQSIYEFSGRSSKYLEELSNDTGFKLFHLDKNHRCHDSIINYSNYLLNSRTTLVQVDEIVVHYSRISGDERAIANWIDVNIDKISKKYGIQDKSQIAILCKSNRTCEIVNSSMKTPHRYIVATDLDYDMNAWSSIFSSLLKYYYGSLKYFVEVVEQYASYEKIRGQSKKELNEARALIDAFKGSSETSIDLIASEFSKIADIIAPNSESQASFEMLLDVLRNEDSKKSYMESSNEEVSILTLHKAKGLEFDVAINLDLYEWIFPQKLPGPNNDFQNPVFSNFTQDMNLHYVGLTRAKKAALLLSSSYRTNYQGLRKPGSESEFLTINGIHRLRR